MKLGTQFRREQVIQETRVYTKRAVRPILRCMLASGTLALLCLFIAQLEIIQRGLLVVLPVAVKLVPSVAAIASATAAPIRTEITLATQWLFAPVYVFFWFYCFPPWSVRMRLMLAGKAKALTPPKRAATLIYSILFLGAWLLGDLGLIGFPTFYNGKYLYPPSATAPQLLLITHSPISLTIYAWLGPIGEASILWAFCTLLLNAKMCLLPKSSVSQNGAS